MGKLLYSINIEDAMMTVDTLDGPKEVPYGMRQGLAGCLLHGELRLNGVQLFERYPLAQRIKSEESNTLLLDDEEYSWLRSAVESIHGFGEYDYQMLERIFNAVKVEVQEKEGGVDDTPLSLVHGESV